MIVDVAKLKTLSFKYNKVMNEYLDSFHNISNIYNNIDKCYKDSDSKKFLLYTQKYQKDSITNSNNINYILNYYNKIIKIYSKFGNKINVNINELPNIINKLNESRSVLKTIATRLEYLHNNGGTYRQNVEFMLNKINTILNLIDEICDDVRKSYKEILDNERILHHEFNLIDFREIKGDFK